MADEVLTGFDRNDNVSSGHAWAAGDSSDEQERATKIIQDFNYLFGLRGNWNTHWTEIAQRIMPDHSFLFQNYSQLTQMGDKRMTQVYDSTGILALQRFGAILDSLLTPRNQQWHQLRANDELLERDRQTSLWFEQVNKILFKQRYAQRSNFSANNQDQYLSLGAYGTGILLIDDLAGNTGLRYKNIHLGQCYLQENHQGVVDRVIRHFIMTARQAYQKFGESCPETLLQVYKDQPERQFFFIHWVGPNEDRDPFKKDYRGMPFASYYVALEGRKLVAKGGYRTFPYAISRYRQSPFEAYGRSPAMDVLPAIKTLNEEKKTMLKAGHRALDPVLLAHDDGVVAAFNFEPGALNPGGVTKEGNLLIHPLPVGSLPEGKDLMEDERKLINDTFLVNLFQILTENPEMTATEVMERVKEKGILLAPTIGRQESEYLGPMIDRELDILSRQGLLPPQPLKLRQAKGHYKIVYDTPISRTQKADQVSGTVRAMEVFVNFAQQTQDPSVLHLINIDKAGPAIADAYGVPISWMNTPEQVAKLRQNAQKMQQQQLAIQAAPAAAGVMKAKAQAGGAGGAGGG
jgi:hypothetical protein